MKKKLWYFQTRLIFIQIFLVLPMLALITAVLIFWVQSSAIKAINESRNDSLQTAAGAFDQIYLRMIKLLEKPYTDTALYNIITTEYETGDGVVKNLNDAKTNKLLNNIIYYEPDIVAITLVLDTTGSVYYKRRAPTISVNIHNTDWYSLQKSKWYQEAMEIDNYLVAPAVKDELYISSGITIPVFQRLMDVLENHKIGVFRLDIGIEGLYTGWKQIVQDPEKDVLLVLDQYNQLIFSSSQKYAEENPLLSVIDPGQLDDKYYKNTWIAPQSQLQFIYLSSDFSTLNLKQPLFLIGMMILAFYVIYATIFIKWSSRFISRPIEKLKNAMIQGQENKLWARCEPLAGEMGELAEAFNQLMEKMEVLIGEATQNEKEKARLSYEVLQSKINPHFLYNTLNAIRYKADMIGAQSIAHGIESLAALLRFTIKCTDEVISFEQELTQLENYLHIMRIRYGDEVEIDFDIDEACYEYQCLKFLIQPMIENCYVHAFGTQKQTKNTVIVRISCNQECIEVVVLDNGMGMTKERVKQLMDVQPNVNKAKYFGIGIDNVKQRIKTLFGAPYSLEIESEYGKYTKVIAVIPKIKKQEETDCNTSERNGHDHTNIR